MADQLFGNKYDARTQQYSNIQKTGSDYAALPRGRVSVAVSGQTGGMLGGIGAELMGLQTPQQARISKLQEIQAQYEHLDISKPENLRTIAGAMLREGFSKEASDIYDMIDKMSSTSTAGNKYAQEGIAKQLEQELAAQGVDLNSLEGKEQLLNSLRAKGLGDTTIYGRYATDVRTLTESGKRQQKFDAEQVESISERMGADEIPNIQDAVNSVGEVINQYKNEAGAYGNIPGISVLEQADQGQEAKKVRSAIARAQNILLKIRSGAAVTDPEFNRLKEEIQGGLLRTDEDIIRWYNDLQTWVNSMKRNIYAGYDQNAVNEYEKRMFGGGDKDSNIDALIKKYR